MPSIVICILLILVFAPALKFPIFSQLSKHSKNIKSSLKDSFYPKVTKTLGFVDASFEERMSEWHYAKALNS